MIGCIYMWILPRWSGHWIRWHIRWSRYLRELTCQNSLRTWEFTEAVQTASMPLEEKEEEKPRPIPLWVCVCDRAISYWTSRLRNISSCCCNVFIPSSFTAAEGPLSSSPCSRQKEPSVRTVLFLKSILFNITKHSLWCPSVCEI